jgi:hypothetical protein
VSLNKHHRRAAGLLGLTALLIVVLGLLLGVTTHAGPALGMYCATGLATTDGCPLVFQGWQSYTLGELSMVTMIPLWGAVFSFITAGLTADHIDKKHDEMKEHVTSQTGSEH